MNESDLGDPGGDPNGVDPTLPGGEEPWAPPDSIGPDQPWVPDQPHGDVGVPGGESSFLGDDVDAESGSGEPGLPDDDTSGRDDSFEAPGESSAEPAVDGEHPPVDLPAEIELGLDDTESTDRASRDGMPAAVPADASGEGPEGHDEDDTFTDAPDTAFDAASGSPFPGPVDGVTPPEVLNHAIDLVGVPADRVSEVAARMGLGEDVELGLDGRSTALLLGELGADSLVDHGSLDDLQARLTPDAAVLLGGDAQHPALRLVSIDVERGTARVESADGGTPGEIDLAELEQAWSQSSYEMVTVEPGATGPIRLGVTVTVLPTAVAAHW